MDLPPAGIIGGAIALALMSLVIWSANRRRPGALPRSAAFYGVPMVALATFMVMVYLAIMIVFTIGVLSGNPTATAWVLLGLGVFGLALAGMVYDVFTRRIDWTDTELRFQSWRGVGECLWSDIASVDYKLVLQYWKIDIQGGRGFAVFEYMTGASDFLEAARRNGVVITVSGRQPPEP